MVRVEVRVRVTVRASVRIRVKVGVGAGITVSVRVKVTGTRTVTVIARCFVVTGRHKRVLCVTRRCGWRSGIWVAPGMEGAQHATGDAG